MRIAVVTESFLPQVNGVTNTVRHVVHRLRQRGHDALVIAPGPGDVTFDGVRVHRVPSLTLPRYRTFRLGLPLGSAERAVVDFRPDLVHLASPALLGRAGSRAAARLDVPVVAVYQTDLVGFAGQYGMPVEAGVGRWVRSLHRRADRTLVPSRASMDQLASLGVPRLHLWRRGVSLDLFSPSMRDERLHEQWTGGDPEAVVVGYVGRLAAEKQVRRLRAVAGLRGIRLVLIGDGPERGWLEQHVPGALCTGTLQGADLARAFASLDVFVHTGEAETFCQTIQEAQASGVAAVAPASGGPLDLITNHTTGLLYRPGSTASLVSHVLTLAGDRHLRARLADAARARVAERTWSAVVDELIDHHYAAALARGQQLPLGGAA